MNPEHMRVLVARRMQQATEALEDGRYLLAAGRGARNGGQSGLLRCVLCGARPAPYVLGYTGALWSISRVFKQQDAKASLSKVIVRG
jgi:hypothetical protein